MDLENKYLKNLTEEQKKAKQEPKPNPSQKPKPKEKDKPNDEDTEQKAKGSNKQKGLVSIDKTLERPSYKIFKLPKKMDRVKLRKIYKQLDLKSIGKNYFPFAYYKQETREDARSYSNSQWLGNLMLNNIEVNFRSFQGMERRIEDTHDYLAKQGQEERTHCCFDPFEAKLWKKLPKVYRWGEVIGNINQELHLYKQKYDRFHHPNDWHGGRGGHSDIWNLHYNYTSPVLGEILGTRHSADLMDSSYSTIQYELSKTRKYANYLKMVTPQDVRVIDKLQVANFTFTLQKKAVYDKLIKKMSMPLVAKLKRIQNLNNTKTKTHLRKGKKINFKNARDPYKRVFQKEIDKTEVFIPKLNIYLDISGSQGHNDSSQMSAQHLAVSILIDVCEKMNWTYSLYFFNDTLLSIRENVNYRSNLKYAIGNLIHIQGGTNIYLTTLHSYVKAYKEPKSSAHKTANIIFTDGQTSDIGILTLAMLKHKFDINTYLISIGEHTNYSERWECGEKYSQEECIKESWNEYFGPLLNWKSGKGKKKISMEDYLKFRENIGAIFYTNNHLGFKIFKPHSKSYFEDLANHLIAIVKEESNLNVLEK